MRLPRKIILLVLIFSNLVQLTNCQNLKLPDMPQVKLSDNINKFSEFFKALISPQNIAKTVAKLIVRRFVKFPKEISTVCVNDVKAALEESANPKMLKNLMSSWPVKMLDSFGKPPAGMLTGNLFWLGSFQQCLDVVAPYNATGTRFVGEYCLAKLYPKTLSQEIVNLAGGLETIKLTIGLCFPSTCSHHDKSLLLNYTLKYAKKYVRAEITKGYCQTKQAQPMDVTTIVIICILSAHVIFVLTATLVDLSSYLKAETTDKLDRPGLGRRLFSSFSAVKSLKAIFKTNNDSSDIRVIHGIRSISILWVIGGHTGLYATKLYPWENELDVFKLFDYFFMQPMTFATTYSVTSFFVISGFLVTYLFIQRSYEQRQSPNIFGYYIYRYLRLSPPVLFMVLFLAGPFYYLNNGPLWPYMYEDNLKICRRLGYWSLLYIQNFAYNGQAVNIKTKLLHTHHSTIMVLHTWFQTNWLNFYPQWGGQIGDFFEICLTVGWYISADTQLYVLAPILLYPLYRKPVLGVILMGTLLAGTTIASIIQFTVTGDPTFFGKHANYVAAQNYLNYIYRRPDYHAPSYIIGMGAGYLFFVMRRNRITLSKKVIIPGWICAIATLLIIMYGTYPYGKGTSEMSPWLNVAYGALVRPAWALAISWIILACALGHGGIINWLLTQTPHVILGRLTFCAYLVHSSILKYYYYGQKNSLYYSIYNTFMVYFAITVISFVAAVLLAVLIEIPVIDALKQLGKKYDKHNQGATIKQLTFEPTHLEKSYEIQKLIIEDSSQDEFENEKNTK